MLKKPSVIVLAIFISMAAGAGIFRHGGPARDTVSGVSSHAPLINLARAEEIKVITLAPAVPTSLPIQVTAPSSEEIRGFLTNLPNAKAAGFMGLVVILVQLLCFFFRSSLAQFAGIYRLLIVQGLTIVLAIGGLKIAGEGWLAIFLDANVLFMLQLYVHQFMTQLAKKEDDEKAIATAVNTP